MQRTPRPGCDRGIKTTLKRTLKMALVKPKLDQTAKQEEVKAETAVEVAAAETPKTSEQKLAEPKVDQPIVAKEEVGTALASVSPHATASVVSFVAEQAEQGFEGAVLDSFSFPRMKLDDGKFLFGTDEEELGESFQFQALKSRPIYVIRQSEDSDAESFYSYDPQGQTHTDGSSAKAKLDEWKEQGYGDSEHPLDVKEYLEMFALLVGGPHDGEVVSLSIPPASRTRFWGQAEVAKIKFRLGTGQVVYEAKVGKKAGDGAKSFRPWLFSIVGPAE